MVNDTYSDIISNAVYSIYNFFYKYTIYLHSPHFAAPVRSPVRTPRFSSQNNLLRSSTLHEQTPPRLPRHTRHVTHITRPRRRSAAPWLQLVRLLFNQLPIGPTFCWQTFPVGCKVVISSTLRHVSDRSIRR